MIGRLVCQYVSFLQTVVRSWLLSWVLLSSLEKVFNNFFYLLCKMNFSISSVEVFVKIANFDFVYSCKGIDNRAARVVVFVCKLQEFVPRSFA